MFLIFDIGGSSTKIAIINEQDSIINKYSIEKKNSLDEFILMLEEETKKAIKSHEIAGIGISSPGTVNPITGEITGISAVEYISDYNFAIHLQKKYKLPVAIENDANCAALCEMYFNKVQENYVAFCIIGSGVGGAIVKDGSLLHGRRLESGEFGYMLLKNSSGKWTNLSQLATLPNVKNRLKVEKNIEISTYELMDKYLEKIEPYYSLVDQMFEYLCVGLYNIQYSLDPEVIYIGGAISQSADFINAIEVKLREETFSEAQIKIRPVSFFNDNNLLGAYINIKKSISEGKKLCIQ